MESSSDKSNYFLKETERGGKSANQSLASKYDKREGLPQDINTEEATPQGTTYGSQSNSQDFTF